MIRGVGTGVIWESGFWKEELARAAVDLSRRKQQRRWPQRSSARLEKTLFLGFYSIRKLLEAKKLSDEIRDSNLPAIRYPARGKRVTLLNWHRAEKLYALDDPKAAEFTLASLCNVFIHSYAFFVMTSESGGLDGVLINSNRTRHHGLFGVAVDDIIGLFESVAQDDPDQATMVLDPATGDYRVSLSKSPHSSRPDAYPFNEKAP